MARVGFDVDDVLHDWYGKAHRASEVAGIANGVVPKTWHPYKEYGVSVEAWHDVLADATLSGYLYSGAPEYGALSGLQRLMDAGHTVHLVTARGYLKHGATVRAQTAKWLEMWDIPHDTLTFSQDKTVVPTDYFLDDRVENVDELKRVGTDAFLMTQTWNVSMWDFPRVGSIKEFVDIVMGEAS